MTPVGFRPRPPVCCTRLARRDSVSGPDDEPPANLATVYLLAGLDSLSRRKSPIDCGRLENALLQERNQTFEQTSGRNGIAIAGNSTLHRFLNCLSYRQPARATTIVGVPSRRSHPTIYHHVTGRHRHHEECAKYQRRRRRWNSECSAAEAQCESQNNTDYCFHCWCISMSVFPGGKMWSAITKPMVIASNRQAPIKRGGAGDGISKNRHPAPITRPRRSPIIAATIVTP